MNFGMIGELDFVADKHGPPITRKVRSEYSPWLTSNITKQMRHRDYLKKQAIRTGSPHLVTTLIN